LGLGLALRTLSYQFYGVRGNGIILKPQFLLGILGFALELPTLGKDKGFLLLPAKQTAR
jgi:hypothetical protein